MVKFSKELRGKKKQKNYVLKPSKELRVNILKIISKKKTKELRGKKIPKFLQKFLFSFFFFSVPEKKTMHFVMDGWIFCENHLLDLIPKTKRYPFGHRTEKTHLEPQKKIRG